jgi:apolipoprotein D and lipocalin family protein
MLRRLRRLALGLLAALALAGCTGVPDGVAPVQGFQAERYLGTWYEIARLDHSFERGLSDVSATYARRDDGGIDVLNRGFDATKGAWREARGRAYFLEGPGVGSLKVSFFGPFYGGYHVMALDPDYHWSMVAGPDHGYLWILARTPSLPEARLQDMLARARQVGFDLSGLIRVEHGRVAAGR